MMLRSCDAGAANAVGVKRSFAEPGRRIVRAQRKAILGARGHHAIGLADALQRQIVDHHADVARAPVERDRVELAGMGRGIETRDQTLCGRLLIAGRAVDLPGKEQAADVAHLERRHEPARIDELIFDRIARANDFGPLQPVDAAQKSS